MHSYIVATVKPWHMKAYKRIISRYPGKWTLVSNEKKLTASLVRRIKPRYIFFPHWSAKVSKEILDLAECVCFHETDVPYGRGGSPIQNLIARGATKTKMTALRMEEGLDTGPVYIKRPLDLSGSAQEIFERSAQLVAVMIRDMVRKSIVPRPQKGKATVFKRRKPEQSNLATLQKPSAKQVFDFIRMLDAETYPRAYLDVGECRLEFSDVRKYGGSVSARATIRKRPYA